MSEDVVEWLRCPDNHMSWTEKRMLDAATEIERLCKVLNDLREACENNSFDGVGFGYWAGWEEVNAAREVLGMTRQTEKEFADSYAVYRKAEDERIRNEMMNPDQGET